MTDPAPEPVKAHQPKAKMTKDEKTFAKNTEAKAAEKAAEEAAQTPVEGT